VIENKEDSRQQKEGARRTVQGARKTSGTEKQSRKHENWKARKKIGLYKRTNPFSCFRGEWFRFPFGFSAFELILYSV